MSNQERNGLICTMWLWSFSWTEVSARGNIFPGDNYIQTALSKEIIFFHRLKLPNVSNTEAKRTTDWERSWRNRRLKVIPYIRNVSSSFLSPRQSVAYLLPETLHKVPGKHHPLLVAADDPIRKMNTAQNEWSCVNAQSPPSRRNSIQ